MCKDTDIGSVAPCSITPEDKGKCFAVPLDETKEEYYRPVQAGDMCVTPEEYGLLQKRYRELESDCASKERTTNAIIQ